MASFPALTGTEEKALSIQKKKRITINVYLIWKYKKLTGQIHNLVKCLILFVQQKKHSILPMGLPYKIILRNTLNDTKFKLKMLPKLLHNHFIWYCYPKPFRVMNLIWAYLIVVIVDHNFAIPSHCYYFTFLWERDDPCNFLFLNTFEFI